MSVLSCYCPAYGNVERAPLQFESLLDIAQIFMQENSLCPKEIKKEKVGEEHKTTGTVSCCSRAS